MFKRRLYTIFMIGAVANAVESETIQEVTVAAPRITNSVESLLQIRKQTNSVTEVLAAEAMSRNGDSDAASSVRRVTGLTLVAGKYVYVRGLGERYSSVLLNGAQVPSPEPARRVVPLDLFPTSILESISVQKSFSPNLPAEFGGGVIELQTKLIPKKFNGNLQVGYSSESSIDAITYTGGKNDFLGMDDGTRSMPIEIKRAFVSNKKLIISEKEGFSVNDIEKMGNQLNNHYDLKKAQTPVIPNMQLSVGDIFRINSFKVGSMAGAMYSTVAETGDKVSRTFNVGANSALEKEDESKTNYTEKEIQLGGALSLGVAFKDKHQVNFNKILLRNTTDLVQTKKSVKSSDSYASRKYDSMEWSERQVDFNQMSGKSEFENIEIKWRLNTSTANRDSPDSREIMRVEENGKYYLKTDVTGNKRVYSELEDQTQEAGVDISLPVMETKNQSAKLKLGAVFNEKKRKSDIYRLHFKNNFTPGTLPDLSRDTEIILANRGINKFILTNITDSADSFKGRQEITSYYAQMDYGPSHRIEMSAGYRLENSEQKVRTFKYYDPENPTSTGRLIMKDLLPSYSLSYKITPEQKLKLVYGETIARPDFRELSTVQYIEDETGYDVIGNNSLKGTVIKNIDFRFENYFDDSDFVSIGAFYKKFHFPIEAIFQPGDKLVKTFVNAPAAYSAGLELEGRTSLRGLSRNLRRWTIASNFSIIDSKVEIDSSKGNQTSKDRPLQGQSPYVANFQLLYDRPQLKITSGLIYNVIGRRITEVGTNSRPDIYEEPIHQLDFVFNQKVDDWSYGFKAKNLLDSKAVSVQGDEVVRERKRGRSYAANLTAYF